MSIRQRTALIGLGLVMLLVAVATTSSGLGSGGFARGHDVPTDGTDWFSLFAGGGTGSGFDPTADDEPEGLIGEGPPESRRIEGSFIVDLAQGLDPHEVAAEVARDYGGEVSHVYDDVVGGFAFTGPDDVRERMANDPRVRDVDADYVAYLVGHTVPLERTAVRAPAAWAVSEGAGAVVAVLDTGLKFDDGDSTRQLPFDPTTMQPTNPHLNGRVRGIDGSCVGDTGTTSTSHGTGSLGHALGHYGLLPQGEGYAVKVFPEGESSTSYTNIICGLNLVKGWTPSRGIHAVNLSLSGSSSSSAMQTAVRDLRDAGVVVVAAAGNSGGSVGYPARYEEAVAVSALSQSNISLASFSSRGPQVDMGAPGQNLATLTTTACCSTSSGTSFSAPQVAAAAALVKTRLPAATVADVVTELQKTGFCPPGTTPNANTDGGNCSTTTQRQGDGDGYPEPALNLEGAAKGLDLPPLGSFVELASGQQVAGEVTLVVSATDDKAVQGVEFDLGTGSFLPADGVDADGRYIKSWNTCPTAPCIDGPITIRARVTDSGSQTLTINLDLVLENTDDPPQASLDTPATGAIVGPSFQVVATATDDRSVPSLELFIDGVSQGLRSAPSSGNTYTWDVSGLAEHQGYQLTVTGSAGPHAISLGPTTVDVVEAVYRHGFDDPAAWTGGWFESTSSSRWHPTAACSDGAPAAPFAYFGLDSTCLFSTDKSGNLNSPVVTGLPANEKLLLTFDSKEKVESCQPPNSYCTRDRRYVQVNYGGGWVNLDYRHAGTNPGSGVWENRQYAMNACTGRVQLRFRFVPNSSTKNNYFGWAVDNVTIRRTGEASVCPT